MRLLLLAVDKGSFSAAGRAMRMPLPTVSRKIAELETHLGARLLTRTTRKLALTDAGAEYMAFARRILSEIDEAERLVAGEFRTPRGELAVAAPILFGRLHILPIVTAFLAAYPEIRVRLPLSDRNVDLVDDHVDMAARIGPLPDSTLVATRVGVLRTVVCASPAMLARHGEPADPPALAALPCIAFESLSAGAIWPFRGARVAIEPRLSVSTAEAAIWAAIQGVGVTRVLHYQCAEALREGSLRLMLQPFETEPQPVHLVHAARSRLPLKTRVFLDYAAPRLRDSLSALQALSGAATGA